MNENFERLLERIDVEFITEHPELTLDLIKYLLNNRAE